MTLLSKIRNSKVGKVGSALASAGVVVIPYEMLNPSVVCAQEKVDISTINIENFSNYVLDELTFDSCPSLEMYNSKEGTGKKLHFEIWDSDGDALYKDSKKDVDMGDFLIINVSGFGYGFSELGVNAVTGDFLMLKPLEKDHYLREFNLSGIEREKYQKIAREIIGFYLENRL